MSDLIERKAGLDALAGLECAGYVEDSWEHMRGVLVNIPAADAVEVVRCKDCKYFDTRDVSGTIPPIVYRCKRFARTYREAEDFCSYAERKETENGMC